MSEAAIEAPQPKKKGGMKKMLIMGVGILVLMGAGVGAGIYASGAGLVGGGHEGPKEDPHAPKLVPREGAAGAEDAPLHPTKGKDGEVTFNRSLYKATYYPIEQTFTSNLRDSDGFMQIGIGVATYYDSRVVDGLKDNEMPVRSAILMTLANQDGFVISTPEGKKALQTELKDAINQVLVSRTGFGGIDDVYFTSFIIQ